MDVKLAVPLRYIQASKIFGRDKNTNDFYQLNWACRYLQQCCTNVTFSSFGSALPGHWNAQTGALGKPTCTQWWGFFSPLPRSEQTLFSTRLPWPSLPGHSRAPFSRRQPWYQRTPPCRPPALLIHSWMPERMLRARVRAADTQQPHFVLWWMTQLETSHTPRQAPCYSVFIVTLIHRGLNHICDLSLSLSLPRSPPLFWPHRDVTGSAGITLTEHDGCCDM